MHFMPALTEVARGFSPRSETEFRELKHRVTSEPSGKVHDSF